MTWAEASSACSKWSPEDSFSWHPLHLHRSWWSLRCVERGWAGSRQSVPPITAGVGLQQNLFWALSGGRGAGLARPATPELPLALPVASPCHTHLLMVTDPLGLC